MESDLPMLRKPKPDNLMFYPQYNILVDDDGVPLLSDFGQSKLIDHRGFTTELMGSPRYMAPELIGGSEVYEVDYRFKAFEVQQDPNLTKETDVFAFSMLAIEVRDSHF
jgi:serine/threonine protein kinase